MIDLQSETDIHLLRQVALLQEREIDHLHHRIGELVSALAKAQGQETTAALQLELLQLNEQLAAQRKALFGRSSERRSPPADRGRREDPQAAPHGPWPAPAG